MKKVEDYRRHSDECRHLAQRCSNPEHRTMLQNMAASWENLADATLAHSKRQQRLAELEREIRMSTLKINKPRKGSR